MKSLYAAFLQGVHSPTARPSARDTNPHAVGFGMKVAPTAAKKKKKAEMPKKILPTFDSLKRSGASIRLVYDGFRIGLRAIA